MKQRKFIIFLLISALMTMYMACSSTAVPAEKEEMETVGVKEEATEVLDEGEEVAEVIDEKEEKAEPTLEAIVYEGIDMESVLPGEEWLETFGGIIKEPKMVVFNDKNNKKMFVEHNQRISFGDGDVFAVYTPNMEVVVATVGLATTESYGTPYYSIIIFDKERFKSTTAWSVELNTGEILKCIITPEFE